MIMASIKDLQRYRGLSVNLDRAIDWIATKVYAAHQEDGRLEIDGDRVFALFMRYETKDPSEALFETHRHHIDIQMLLKVQNVSRWRMQQDCRQRFPMSMTSNSSKSPILLPTLSCSLRGTRSSSFPKMPTGPRFQWDPDGPPVIRWW